MSQTYHCQLQESVSVNVTFGDRITHALNLTEILPLEEMKDLLRQQLRDLGFSEDSDRFTHTDNAVTTEIDLNTMEVTLSRSGEKQLSTTATSTGRSWRNKSDAKSQAEAGLASAVEGARQRLQAEGDRLQRAETAAVEAADAEMTELLHTAIQQVYTESLKRKARALGDVLSVHESTSDDGEYELIIQIEQ